MTTSEFRTRLNDLISEYDLSLSDEIVMGNMDVLVKEYACCPTRFLSKTGGKLKRKIIKKVEKWYEEIYKSKRDNNKTSTKVL